MKKQFFDTIDQIMADNPDVYLLMAGLGYPRTQELIEKYPGRAINSEAAEQTTLDMAVGLAYAGKTPVVYTITPFLWRGFETIRTYINHEKLNVKLVGVGRDDDYSKHDGFSHYAGDDKAIIETCFPHFTRCWPQNEEQAIDAIHEMIVTPGPVYINLRR